MGNIRDIHNHDTPATDLQLGKANMEVVQASTSGRSVTSTSYLVRPNMKVNSCCYVEKIAHYESMTYLRSLIVDLGISPFSLVRPTAVSGNVSRPWLWRRPEEGRARHTCSAVQVLAFTPQDLDAKKFLESHAPEVNVRRTQHRKRLTHRKLSAGSDLLGNSQYQDMSLLQMV